MRSCVRLILVAIVLAGFACARPWYQGVSVPPHIEKSVFPVYVLDEQTTAMGFLNNGRAPTKWRAATAVYVAPHLLATSAALFNSASATINTNNVLVVNGNDFLHVEDVYQFSDVAIIRTAEAGVSLPSEPEDSVSRGPYRLVGLNFKIRPRGLPEPRGKTVGVSPATGGASRINNYSVFVVDAKNLSGITAGSVILDRQQRLVGIVNRGYYDRVSIVGVAKIRSFLPECKHEP